MNIRIKKVELWSLLTHCNHPALESAGISFSWLEIFEAIFPGVIEKREENGQNLYCMSCTQIDFISSNYAEPLLNKLFPYLQYAPYDAISIDEEVEIGEFLPSRVDEYQTQTWQDKFKHRFENLQVTSRIIFVD